MMQPYGNTNHSIPFNDARFANINNFFPNVSNVRSDISMGQNYMNNNAPTSSNQMNIRYPYGRANFPTNFYNGPYNFH